MSMANSDARKRHLEKLAELADAIAETQSVEIAADGVRALMDEEPAAEFKVEKEHRWFEYGRWFKGFGSSMDPHYCGEPGTKCEWRERTVSIGEWSDWGEK